MTRLSRGGGQGLYATVVSSLACAVVPGQWVAPRTWQQAALLVGTGAAPLFCDESHSVTLAGEMRCADTCLMYGTCAL